MSDTNPSAKVSDKIKAAKVLVATPNYTNLFSSEVHTNHVECAVHWAKHGLNYQWLIHGRTFVHFARSQACHVALMGDFTHVFWLDDDAIVSPDLLLKYLELDLDVIVTPYFMRRPPYEIGCLVSTTGNFHDHKSYRNLTLKDLHQGVIEIDGGGTHAMLMKTSVLRTPGVNDSANALDPALRTFIDKLSEEDKLLLDHHIGTLPDERLTLEDEDKCGLKAFFIMPKAGTEDMLFCYRLKRKGVKIHCDTDATSGHVGFPPVITEAFRVQTEALALQSADQRHDGAMVTKVVPRDITAGPGTMGVTSARLEAVDSAHTASLV